VSTLSFVLYAGHLPWSRRLAAFCDLNHHIPRSANIQFPSVVLMLPIAKTTIRHTIPPFPFPSRATVGHFPYISDPTIRLCPQSSLLLSMIPAVTRHLLDAAVQDRRALCTCPCPPGVRNPGEHPDAYTRRSKPLNASSRRILNDDSKFSYTSHERRWPYRPELTTKMITSPRAFRSLSVGN
jgi:hypothetical protein